MNVRLVSKVALGSLAVSAFAAVAVAWSAPPTPRFVAGWTGIVAHRSDAVANTSIETYVEVFVDNNGCEYLVTTSGSYSDYSVSQSITPRINAQTRQPFCRAQ